MLVLGLDVSVTGGVRVRVKVEVRSELETPRVRNARVRKVQGTKCLEAV